MACSIVRIESLVEGTYFSALLLCGGAAHGPHAGNCHGTGDTRDGHLFCVSDRDALPQGTCVMQRRRQRQKQEL